MGDQSKNVECLGKKFAEKVGCKILTRNIAIELVPLKTPSYSRPSGQRTSIAVFLGGEPSSKML